jgi:IS4 transposase
MNCWTGRTVLIQLEFKRLATFWTREGINTVPHQNIVMHDLVKHVPWARLDELVAAHGSDGSARKLTTKRHFLALLYAQLSGASSLREIEAGLSSHESRLYHLGGAPLRRSTLSEANRGRPVAVFSGMLEALMKQAHRRLRQALRESIYLIDATVLPLNGLSADWAAFSTGVCGAKAHVIYDPAADCPIYASVTTRSVNDITAAKDMPIEAGATYVFDLGYYDYAWWAALDAKGCRIVTRFKSHTPLILTETRKVPPTGPILSDRVGHLPKRQAKNRKNPFQEPVREICVTIETGKTLRILTNDLEASAQEIAGLYKRRWAIELFFRWVKQALKIKKFLGTNENAIRIQIAVALIAFLLLRIAHQVTRCPFSLLTFTRLVKTNLMHRRRIDRLLDTLATYQPEPQMQLQWN